MIDPEDERLAEVERLFALAVAQARAHGAELADVLVAAGVALGRATATIPDGATAWRALGGVADVARRAYRVERNAMERAEQVVYRSGGAVRPRRRR